MADADSVPRRRDQYAEMTRQAVVAAARSLFAERGYTATTVAEIARAARVSPATVYAQCGGKEGVLATLMDMWTAGQLVRDIIGECAGRPSPPEKLAALADGYVAIYAEFGDIIGIVTQAAVTTSAARAFLDAADQRHLAALREIIAPLRDAGHLAAGLSVEDAARIVFFHFRHAQWSLAVDGFGWGIERATTWITRQIERILIAD